MNECQKRSSSHSVAIFLISEIFCRFEIWDQVNGLAQDCCNSIAYALELLQSCSNPSMWVYGPGSCLVLCGALVFVRTVVVCIVTLKLFVNFRLLTCAVCHILLHISFFSSIVIFCFYFLWYMHEDVIISMFLDISVVSYLSWSKILMHASYSMH